MQAMLGAVVRWLMTGIGAAIVARGCMDADRWGQWTSWAVDGVGFLLPLAALAWSAWIKRHQVRPVAMKTSALQMCDHCGNEYPVSKLRWIIRDGGNRLICDRCAGLLPPDPPTRPGSNANDTYLEPPASGAVAGIVALLVGIVAAG